MISIFRLMCSCPSKSNVYRLSNSPVTLKMRKQFDFVYRNSPTPVAVTLAHMSDYFISFPLVVEQTVKTNAVGFVEIELKKKFI